MNTIVNNLSASRADHSANAETTAPPCGRGSSAPDSDTAGGGGGGGSEPDRILHEGRGQEQPTNPGFSSLILFCIASPSKRLRSCP